MFHCWKANRGLKLSRNLWRKKKPPFFTSGQLDSMTTTHPRFGFDRGRLPHTTRTCPGKIQNVIASMSRHSREPNAPPNSAYGHV